MDLKFFYKNKKILITGHTGFKGSWLSLWLLNLEANIAGYSLNPNTSPNLHDVLGLHNKMVNVVGDVRDKDCLQSFVQDFQPEIVIHMAAQALVRESYEDPVTTYETNVMGTVNILEVCRECSFVRSVVIVTTDKCYANYGGDESFKETDPMGGHDPYSSSKGCAELVVAAYQASFFSSEKYGSDHKIGLASVRAGNVIGGGDWNQDRLIPDCVKAIFNNEDLIIRYPQAIRPWQHVLEPLYGYLLLAKRLYEEGCDFSGPWNFGPENENEKSVKFVIEKIYELWGGGYSWKLDPQQQPYEASTLRLDSQKAKSLLDWHSRLELASALSETVQWYKAWEKGNDMYAFSLIQIEDYCKDKKE